MNPKQARSKLPSTRPAKSPRDFTREICEAKKKGDVRGFPLVMSLGRIAEKKLTKEVDLLLLGVTLIQLLWLHEQKKCEIAISFETMDQFIARNTDWGFDQAFAMAMLAATNIILTLDPKVTLSPSVEPRLPTWIQNMFNCVGLMIKRRGLDPIVCLENYLQRLQKSKTYVPG